MTNKLNKKSQGFTIIEVLIVLAIAGLIMLIVFLAVPALERNARNTQRRSDIGRIGGAITEVLNNNNGQISFITGATGQTAVQNQMGTLGYYTTAGAVTVGVPTSTSTNGTTIDTVVYYPGAVCAALPGGAVGNGATTANASLRNVAITYSVETGNGLNPNCSQL